MLDFGDEAITFVQTKLSFTIRYGLILYPQSPLPRTQQPATGLYPELNKFMKVNK
jgi:hypothetical protein